MLLPRRIPRPWLPRCNEPVILARTCTGPENRPLCAVTAHLRLDPDSALPCARLAFRSGCIAVAPPPARA